MHTNQIMVKVTESLIVRALACLFCIGMYVSTMLICIANAAIYSTCDTYTLLEANQILSHVAV